MDTLILIVMVASIILLACKAMHFASSKLSDSIRLMNLERELEDLPNDHKDKLHSYLTSDKERRKWALQVKARRMGEDR